MTTRYNVLTIGNNPNIAFYSWRLFSSKVCDLSIINDTSLTSADSTSTINNTFQWTSKEFGNSRYTCSNTYHSLDDYLARTTNKYVDYLFVSAVSLQELSSFFSKLSQVIKNQIAESNKTPVIIVESTNFVNLEPFIKMSLQIDSVSVLSIMSDYDVRIVGNNVFNIYRSKKESELLYIGRSGTENKYTSNEINLINQVSSLFEAAGIDVYKLNTPLEFLSYQWKFALPKIAIEPLSILFEKPFPKELQDQILAKPLVSGLILEIITVIKTMGCKLFKSYDNETSLLERLCELYPVTKLSDDYAEAPRLFYDFFNQNEVYLDLLLLQPILLADDYQVKTPYLEFLYAMLTQFNNNNFSTLSSSTSLFWLRKNEENIRSLKLDQEKIALDNATKQKNIDDAQTALDKPQVTQNIPQQQQQIPLQQQQQQPQVPSTQPELQQQIAYPGQVTRVINGHNVQSSGSYGLEDLADMTAAYGIEDTPPTQPQTQYAPTGQSVQDEYQQGYSQAPVQQQPTGPLPGQKQIPSIYNKQTQQPQPQLQAQPQAQPQLQVPQDSAPRYDQYGNLISRGPQQQPNPQQGVPPQQQYYNSNSYNGNGYNNGGGSSPTYAPPQNLPHGLPSQGLPVRQQIFSNNYDKPVQQVRRQPSIPMSLTNDNLSMMNGGMGMNNAKNYPMGSSSQYDLNGGNLNGNGGDMRGFRATSRKNRKSQMVLGNDLGFGGGNRGMPGPQRYSVMPGMPMGGANQYPGQNGMNRAPSNQAVNTMNRNNRTGTGLGINNNYPNGPYGAQQQQNPYDSQAVDQQYPAPQRSQSSSYLLGQQQTQPQQQQPLQQQGQPQFNPQKPVYPPVAQQGQSSSESVDAFTKPEHPSQYSDSPQHSDGSENGGPEYNEGNSGANGSGSKSNLVPVPEATPSPMPVYHVKQDSEKDSKKKKRGLFGRKK